MPPLEYIIKILILKWCHLGIVSQIYMAMYSLYKANPIIVRKKTEI